MSTAFTKIAFDYENSLFDYFPELGLFWGKSGVALDRFTDYSVRALKQWQEKEDCFLSALNQIDEASLNKTSSYYTFLLLKETLENKKASRICREELWDINPLWGWHNKMTMTAEKQPVGTEEYRKLALKRWGTFDKIVNDQIDNLKLGLDLEYLAPKPAVERVLIQIKIIMNCPLEESFFIRLRNEIAILTLKFK